MCDRHQHTHHFEDRDPAAADSREAKEIRRRWPIALHELKSLVDRMKDWQGANPEKLHPNLSKIEKKRLREALMAAILSDDKPELKRSVVRKMADKIGDYLLWRRESSIPVIHELIVLLPWWISHFPGEVIPKIRDIGLENILNGSVVPVQKVWQEVLSADPVYLGHCACRSAGVVDDLKKDGQVFQMVSEADGRRLLDRFVDRYQRLKDQYGQVPDTDPEYAALCDGLLALRAKGSSHYRLEKLISDTYPHWEILPVHGNYTPSWIRSMHRNHKAHLIHRELVFELSTILYLSRGTLFSSMKLFDTPYTICSCPTPELGGGCTLTNWYYYGGSNTSLMSNTQCFGQRTDDTGNILPCRYFPVRSKRECMGCGCAHDRENPRDIETILELADAAYAEYAHGAGNHHID